MIRATEKVHLLSTWDEGVPPEIGREDLYGLFWNPAHLIAALREIPGFVRAHRVGTDSLTPFFGRVLRDLVPGIELSCRLHGHSVHLLGYLFDPADAELAAECAKIREHRLDRARAIVEATAHFEDAELLAKVSANLGEPMVGINIDTLEPEQRYAGRGW